MSKYKGKVVLAVNVASQCGFTKQYKVYQLAAKCVFARKRTAVSLVLHLAG